MRSDVLSVLFVFFVFLLSRALGLPLPPTNPTTQTSPNATVLPKGFVSKHDASELNTVLNTTFFVHVPLGFGFVEDTSKTAEVCHSFDFHFSTNNSHKLVEFIQNECKVSRRDKRMMESLAYWGPWRASRKMAVEEAAERDIVLIQKFQKGVYERIEALEWKKFRDDVFVNNAVRNTLEYFQISLDEFMELFGINARFGTDMLMDFSQEVYCLKNGNYVLKVCGPTNPTRKYGVINEIVPHGSFATNGMVYRFRNVPKYAVESQNRLHSTGTCERRGAHYKCSQNSNDQCTINDFVHCPIVTVATPETVYVKDVEDMTFIVTDPKKHPKYKLGDEDRSVPTDGAFLISFPHNITLKIASIKIKGRHVEHFVKNVSILQSYNDVTHEELYMAVRNGHMSESEANEIHRAMAAQYGAVSEENFVYYLGWLKELLPGWAWTLMWIIISIIAVLGVALLLIVCIGQRALWDCGEGIANIFKCFCCCVKCCTKPGREKLHE